MKLPFSRPFRQGCGRKKFFAFATIRRRFDALTIARDRAAYRPRCDRYVMDCSARRNIRSVPARALVSRCAN
jgi:hypothetical protein